MLKKSVNGCNGDSFGGHCVLEGDRVALLKGHGQALEQKYCFPGIFSDGCGASANLLNEFDGQAVPCASCFHGKVFFGHVFFLSQARSRNCFQGRSYIFCLGYVSLSLPFPPLLSIPSFPWFPFLSPPHHLIQLRSRIAVSSPSGVSGGHKRILGIF